MKTELPVDRVNGLPLHRNSKLTVSPHFDEKVLVAEHVPANKTFRVVYSNGVTLRLVVLTEDFVSSEWKVVSEVSFPAPVSSPAPEVTSTGIMSTGIEMFHLVEEPANLPMVPAKTLEYVNGMLLFGGQPTPARLKCYSVALRQRVSVS